jgi:hypothetical protein
MARRILLFLSGLVWLSGGAVGILLGGYVANGEAQAQGNWANGVPFFAAGSVLAVAGTLLLVVGFRFVLRKRSPPSWSILPMCGGDWLVLLICYQIGDETLFLEVGAFVSIVGIVALLEAYRSRGPVRA